MMRILLGRLGPLGSFVKNNKQNKKILTDVVGKKGKQIPEKIKDTVVNAEKADKKNPPKDYQSSQQIKEDSHQIKAKKEDQISQSAHQINEPNSNIDNKNIAHNRTTKNSAKTNQNNAKNVNFTKPFLTRNTRVAPQQTRFGNINKTLNEKPFNLKEYFDAEAKRRKLYFEQTNALITRTQAETIDNALRRLTENDCFGNKSLHNEVEKLRKLLDQAGEKKSINFNAQFDLQKELNQRIQNLEKHFDELKAIVETTNKDNNKNFEDLTKVTKSNNSDAYETAATKFGGLFTVIGTLLTAIVILNERREKQSDLKEKEQLHNRRIVELQRQKQVLVSKQETLESKLKSESFVERQFSTTTRDLRDVKNNINQLDSKLSEEQINLQMTQEKLGVSSSAANKGDKVNLPAEETFKKEVEENKNQQREGSKFTLGK